MDTLVKERFSAVIIPNQNNIYAYNLETTEGELQFKHWDQYTEPF